MAGLLGLVPLCTAPHVNAQESVVQKELNRRIQNARTAYTLLESGDTAYEKADYTKAVEHYSKAFGLLPPGAKNHAIREAAAERYATAATERARALAKTGDYEQAKALLKTVLKPEVAPAHTGALKLLGQIDDPIRYNHALTPAHVRNVQKVGMLLREAQGFHSLGQYNRATEVYQAVLRIDPYNKAARRGMEQINLVKSDYYRAARDHNRAAMLAEVDRNWELPVNPTPDSIPTGPDFLDGDSANAPDLRERLSSIIVDNVILESVTLEEAIDFVRIQSRKNDIPDAAGEASGVNVLINLGDLNNERVQTIRAQKVTLKARGLPLSKILDYITDQTYTQWRVDGVSVVITPRGSTENTMVTRTFRVPPNFLSAGATQKAEANNDPFAEDNEEEGKLTQKMSITEFLKANGISFPDGATASYTPSSNTLLVRNTPANIDLIDQLVSIIADEEPVMVVIKTTIMRVSDEKLKELGFDWRVSPIDIIRRGLFLGGGTTGNGTELGTFPGPPFTALSGNPVTSGNRSGNSAIAADAIDTFLNASSTGVASDTSTRAPGILSFSGVYSGVQVQMLMRGLNNKTGVDVMTRPSVITRSGERAKVEIIREFIYPTEYEPPELPNTVGINPGIGGGLPGTVQGQGTFPVTPATPTAFETRNVGVTLEAEPTVGPNKQFIELSIQPEMVEFEGFINYGVPINGLSTDANIGALTDNRILMPVFQTLRLQNSTVTIQDGATIVLGGLRTSRRTKVEDKVPILGDLPLAGRLFKSDSSRTFREAVLIMVTAELVDPTGEPWRNR